MQTLWSSYNYGGDMFHQHNALLTSLTSELVRQQDFANSTLPSFHEKLIQTHMVSKIKADIIIRVKCSVISDAC